MILPDSMACINTIFTTGQADQMTQLQWRRTFLSPPSLLCIPLVFGEESYLVKEEWGSLVRAS